MTNEGRCLLEPWDQNTNYEVQKEKKGFQFHLIACIESVHVSHCFWNGMLWMGRFALSTLFFRPKAPARNLIRVLTGKSKYERYSCDANSRVLLIHFSTALVAGWPKTATLASARGISYGCGLEYGERSFALGRRGLFL